MKSFAVFAAVAGVAVAQSLGDCAQLCVNNMAQIANSQLSCGANDIQCFCSRSNWAYGVRDCSAQACDAEQAAQAVSYAAGQCGGVSAPSGTELAAVPILSSALAGVSSGVASITESAASAASSVASDASSLTGSLASEASSAISSAESAASSAASSASDALSSATESLASRASSATSGAGGAPSTSQNSAPMMTGMPLAAVAGIAALLI